MGLGNQASKDVVELLFPEKRGHGSNSKELPLVGIISGGLDSIHHGILICVLAVGTAFHQLVARPVFPADGCLQGVFLDVGCPADQLVQLSEDRFHFFIGEQGRLPELVLCQRHVGFGSLPTVGFCLAELTPLAAVIFTSAIEGQFSGGHQNLACPIQ